MTLGGGSADMEDDEKPRTVLVGNIPRGTQKREIEEVFGDVGPLKRCYIQYPREDKKKRAGDNANSTLLCYVTYALPEDAVKAIETLGSHKIGGSKIFVKFTKTRSEQVRPKAPGDDGNKIGGGGGEPRKYGKEQRNPNMLPLGDGETSMERGEERPKKPKAPRPKTESKKSRLIVRNLSFKATEEKMKEYFSSCGEIKDVNILKKPDGKMVGCAFIQFVTVPQAAKAVRELNLKPFMGRPVAIDWAIPKKDFQDGEEVKEEPADSEVIDDSEDIKIKEEPESEMEQDDSEVTFVNPYDSMKEEIKEEDEDGSNKRKRKIKEESSESEDEESDEDEDEESSSAKRQRRSNDVEEGKTLFIRNLDFGVTEEDLKGFFETYGKTVYALVCKDRLTEHPKGTGFVKYMNVADANKCLTEHNTEPSKFTLSGRKFSITVAVTKDKLNSSSEKKEKIKHDNRNLYLVREGFIRPASSAAAGVSISDMNKRAALNSTKKQILKNLGIFVSPVRLCVHNLPLKITDTGLRKIFKKYSPPEARIIESRIMRDMKDIQLGGKGKSKGFGFISFTEHEHALESLRAVNNNPEIFSPHQRPIVEFSLENRKALHAKEMRKQKSIENNKLAANPSPSDKWGKRNPTKVKLEIPKPLPSKKTVDKQDARKQDKASNVPYAGLAGKPGVSKLPAMKAKHLKGKITRNSLKASKAKKKKLQERKVREPQIKPKRQIDRPDKSEKIVSNYKKTLEKASSTKPKKTKWYK